MDLCLMSHNLRNEMRTAHNALESYLENQLVEENLEFEIQVLKDRLQEELSPLNYLKLNKSAFLNMITAQMTYFIVLAQFRFAM